MFINLIVCFTLTIKLIVCFTLTINLIVCFTLTIKLIVCFTLNIKLLVCFTVTLQLSINSPSNDNDRIVNDSSLVVYLYYKEGCLCFCLLNVTQYNAGVYCVYYAGKCLCMCVMCSIMIVSECTYY